MHQYLYLIAALLALLPLSTCTTYCIAPEDGEANAVCLTFTQFANSSRDLQSNTITLILQPGNYTLDAEIFIFNVSQFSMLGNASTVTASPLNFTIVCESQAKFSFEAVNSIFIHGLSFVGCGDNTFSGVDQLTINDTIFSGTEESPTAIMLKQTTASIISSDFVSNRNGRNENGTYGAITASMTSNVSIDDCLFQNNSADYGGAIYAELGSTVRLTKCIFSGNSAFSYGSSIHASASIISISECTFSDNGGGTGSHVISLFNGTEPTLISRTNFSNNSKVILSVFNDITMMNCDFDYNRVPGNMVYIEVRSSLSIEYEGIVLVDSSKITLNNTSFYANEATESGGILVLNNAELITTSNVAYKENKAYEGTVVMIDSTASFYGTVEFNNNLGALTAVMSNVEFSGITLFSDNTPSTRDNDVLRGGAATIYFGTLRFTGINTTFTGNRALNGGAIQAIESNVYITTVTTITNNTAQLGGGVFMNRASLFILANTSILSNLAEYGGGIYILSATIFVTSSKESTVHSLAITSNTAKSGGGLFLSSNAHIYLYHIDARPHNISTVLVSNSAKNGGAIYVRDDSIMGVCEADSSSDVIHCFFQVVDLFRERGSVELYFESNTASVSGPLLFGGLLDRCTVSLLANSSFFETDLGSLQFNGMSYLRNVSNIKNADCITSHPVSVCFCFEDEPNCSLKVQSVTEQKGRNFKVSVIAFDHVGHALNATVFSTLQLPTRGDLDEGLRSQTVDDFCTNLTFSVTSVDDHERIIIYADGPCGSAGPSNRTIEVTFSDCSCPPGFDVNPNQMNACECVCSEFLADHVSSCIMETETFTKIDNTWIGYTNTTDSGGLIISSFCPYEYCHPPPKSFSLPNGASLQCANNRAGDLCGGCAQGYSLAVNQLGCVKCDDLWPLYTALISLATLTVGTLTVIVILFLKLTVTAGTINGFIFSANILKPIFPYPSKKYPTYLISFFNLDIGLNVCFYDGFDTYTKTWLELLFPIYLIFIVVMVIIISECSSKFARFIGKRNPVETLATLIFLSYANLLQFTIFALSHGVLKFSNGDYERVWLPDANIIFFSAKHTIMFIAAIIVLALVLIYTLLLFSWQWLIRLPNWKIFAVIRNTKLHSFIEMYHIPHNAKHRYWTGLLLLIRIIVYLVAVSTSSSDSTANHFTIVTALTILFFLKSLTIRVYKVWPVDILESVLIAVTIILSASSWYANDNRILIAVTYTSTIVMGSLFIGVVVYHTNRYVFKYKFDIKEQLTKVCLKVRQRLQAAESRSNHNQEQEGVTTELPAHLRHLNVNRFGSILCIMDSPTSSDYNQLQQPEMSTERIKEPAPVQPTSSILEGPSPIPESSTVSSL